MFLLGLWDYGQAHELGGGGQWTERNSCNSTEIQVLQCQFSKMKPVTSLLAFLALLLPARHVPVILPATITHRHHQPSLLALTPCCQTVRLRPQGSPVLVSWELRFSPLTERALLYCLMEGKP